MSKIKPISKITNDIYVGPKLENYSRLKKHKIKSILNLTGHEIKNEVWCKVSDKKLKVEQLDEAIKLIRRLKKPIYVHCVVGRNRSPLVIATYLTLYERRFDSLFQALSFVKERHSYSSPRKNNIETAIRYISSLS